MAWTAAGDRSPVLWCAARLIASLLAALTALPVAAADIGPICTDRPTKSNFACTVPRGHIQIEADVLNWTGNQAGGTRTDQLMVTNPTFKYGLTSSSDVQLNWAPLIVVRSRDDDGNVGTQSGIGDVTLRFKQRLTPAEGAFQLALLPFVKLPTAQIGIGNGRVEGGMAVPVNIGVPGGWTITFGPQIDILADSDGDGYHAGFTGLINLAKQLGAVTLYGELWTNQNFDPAGTVRQYSFDTALAWLIKPTLQLDAGANVGLNASTADLVLYTGVSVLF